MVNFHRLLRERREILTVAQIRAMSRLLADHADAIYRRADRAEWRGSSEADEGALAHRPRDAGPPRRARGRSGDAGNVRAPCQVGRCKAPGDGARDPGAPDRS
jgi:hypothetical protein